MRREVPAWVVLAVLTVVSFFNYLDRMALSVLVSQIKVDLALSDAQMGLITGLAFALFYAALAVPIARFADRGNKAAILSVCIAIWSGATAISGAATSFAMLFLARTFVGIGEAGCIPASLALIAQRFAVAQRPLAISVFQSGLLIGSAVGLVAAGWLDQAVGWRGTLALIGVAGLPVAILVAVVLRTKSDQIPAVRQAQAAQATAVGDIKILLSRPAFVHSVAGLSLASFGTYSLFQWLPTHLMRTFHLPSHQAGLVLGSAVGIGGILGILSGGVITGLLIRRDRRWDLWLPTLVYLIVAPVYYLAVATSDLHVSGQMTFAGVTIMFVANGAGLAAIQRFSEPERRATANAILLVLSAVFGVGLGPVVVGLVSDLLQPQLSAAASLRFALMMATVTFVWASVHFLIAARFDREKDEVAALNKLG